MKPPKISFCHLLIPSSPTSNQKQFSKPSALLCSQIHDFTHPLLLNFTGCGPTHSATSKSTKSGNTHLLTPSVSTPVSKNSDFGKTQLLILSKQSKPTIKTNPEPSIFLFRNSQKPINNAASYQPILPQIVQRRLFCGESSDPSGSNPIPVDSSQPIDAGTSIRKPISLWPGMYHSPVTNALWEARASIFERPSTSLGDTSAQLELSTKTPSQSRTSISYKLSGDYVLREQYRNPWNSIRMGKLVEDLDALAGTISYKHCCNNNGATQPLLLVTASVDKIVLKKPIRVDTDLTIAGAVTWVGRSSMEIQLEVTQSSAEMHDSSDSVALIANFTFVARDSRTGKSALVNRLQPESDQEKFLWEEAEERDRMRKQKRAQQQKKEIDDCEKDRLNKLLSEGRVFCDMPALADRDSILIRDTCLQNSLICQPQQRNIHGRIFGGFLIRRAFELGFATAYTFAGSAPCFLEVDHVDFLRPVDVGNFLRLKSCVLYTELENPDQPLINVEVVAHVTRPEYRSSQVSNKFYFTFTIHSEAVKSGLKIRNVVPATEEEARRVIERMDAEEEAWRVIERMDAEVS